MKQYLFLVFIFLICLILQFLYIPKEYSFYDNKTMLNADLSEVIKSKCITDLVIPFMSRESIYIKWCEFQIGSKWDDHPVSNYWPQSFNSYSVKYESLKSVHLFSLKEDLLKYILYIFKIEMNQDLIIHTKLFIEYSNLITIILNQQMN